MKMLPIDHCGDCPHYKWIDISYSFECGLTCELVRYKEIGVDKALMELFNQCPLQEYSMSETKLLSAFLVEQGLAEEYVRWKRDLVDYDVHHYDRWVDQIKEYVEEINEGFEYNREFIIKLCLAYTLQSLRNDENLKRFRWGMINDE